MREFQTTSDGARRDDGVKRGATEEGESNNKLALAPFPLSQSVKAQKEGRNSLESERASERGG